MSDSVTHAEVEDVLSSIRRLVGENKKSEREGPKKGGVERLILTPQLRVPKTDVLRLEASDAVAPQMAIVEKNVPTESPSTAQTADRISQPEDVLAAKGFQVPEHGKKFGSSDVFELSAKVAALETAIGRTADQWEPDGAGRDAYAGTQPPAIKWRDDVELDAHGKQLYSEPESEETTAVEADVVEAEKPAPRENAMADVLATTESLLDEDALRDLVSDIVRSELQGALGERITRNVRKLVRREIHRALAAQELE